MIWNWFSWYIGLILGMVLIILFYEYKLYQIRELEAQK